MRFCIITKSLGILLCAALLPVCAQAEGFADILRPDYKKVYDPGKEFGAKEFNANKQFIIKDTANGTGDDRSL